MSVNIVLSKQILPNNVKRVFLVSWGFFFKVKKYIQEKIYNFCLTFICITYPLRKKIKDQNKALPASSSMSLPVFKVFYFSKMFFWLWLFLHLLQLLRNKEDIFKCNKTTGYIFDIVILSHYPQKGQVMKWDWDVIQLLLNSTITWVIIIHLKLKLLTKCYRS